MRSYAPGALECERRGEWGVGRKIRRAPSRREECVLETGSIQVTETPLVVFVLRRAGVPAADVIKGGPLLRDWVDDALATPQDLDSLAISDEQAWLSQRQEYLCY